MPRNETAERVLRQMKEQYGDEEGERVFYATANKQKRDERTWKKRADAPRKKRSKPEWLSAALAGAGMGAGKGLFASFLLRRRFGDGPEKLPGTLGGGALAGAGVGALLGLGMEKLRVSRENREEEETMEKTGATQILQQLLRRGDTVVAKTAASRGDDGDVEYVYEGNRRKKRPSFLESTLGGLATGAVGGTMMGAALPAVRGALDYHEVKPLRANIPKLLQNRNNTRSTADKHPPERVQADAVEADRRIADVLGDSYAEGAWKGLEREGLRSGLTGGALGAITGTALGALGHLLKL